MGKIVINHSPSGVVLDVDALRRFINEAKDAAGGDRDSVEVLPHSAHYIGQMLARLLEDESASE